MYDHIFKRAQSLHGDKITCEKKHPQQLEIKTDRHYVMNLLSWLKTESYVHLAFISCIDWIEENQFELVYHVYSYEEKNHILVKTRLDRDRPWMHSIIDVWGHAQPYEQEIHEMFGVYFPGNPDLSGLFLHNWKDLPPMRKDFNPKDYSLALYSLKGMGHEALDMDFIQEITELEVE
ncbi:NADH-quinone oxidoreductase subunit C [Myxococcota bacterium]|nr:NADH-quinone oxidoreductase subunit C [Myxococcota bacterium]MBU1383052.1 NADH-quinone oxidoreductase subunit C [Myxococcota bacterium]MBU1497611.1 NADH-quinone oxidoreductase subunit C [Myxococcota bacterium]